MLLGAEPGTADSVDRQKPGREPGELDPGGARRRKSRTTSFRNGAPYVINLLRINGEQQVMLKVTVAEVNRSAARSIGMNFSLTNNSGITTFGNYTGSIVTGGLTYGGINGGIVPSGFGFGMAGSAPNLYNNALTQGAGGFNNLPFALDNGQVLGAISALRDLDYAKSLAEPNLVALNGQTATFHAGGEFPVPVVSAYSDYGLQGVNFIPYRGAVQLHPVHHRSGSGAAANLGGREQPRFGCRHDFDQRGIGAHAFDAEFQHDGGAARRADAGRRGLDPEQSRRRCHARTAAGGPADHRPAIRLRSFERRRTGAGRLDHAQLVHPMNPKEVPPLPGSDLFEPSDIEFYLLGRLESHHPYDYRSPIRTDWQRIREYRRMENTYLSGPSGPSEQH